MKKKFLTRRGFTIVEVLVAFVIFAIMAAMVAMILNTTMRTKQQNTALEEEISQQQTVYYGKTQEKAFDSSSTEQLTFNFSGVAPVNIGYSIGNPNADDADNQIALEYFVGDVNYGALSGSNSNQDKGSGGNGSVTDRFEKTSIYGSNGLTSINVVLQRDTSYAEGYRYLIAAKALGDEDAQYDIFKQYRLIFPCGIVNYGYCNYEQASRKFRDVGTASHSGYNITIPSPGTIRVAAAQSASTGPLTSQGYRAFFVELDSELESISSTLNLYDIFGCCETDQTDKSAQSDGSYLFTRYVEKTTDEDGKAVENTHVNVFAAVEKEKTES